MAAELSDLPETPDDLEDYVAALFLAAGHFVEKNVADADLLELDIVATDYEQDPPDVVLCEAKSGGWHVHDLFKIVGWMRYLGIERGAFFCTKPSAEEHFSRVQEVFNPMGLTVVNLGDFSDPSTTFEQAGLPTIADPDEITHWRWVHGVERRLTKKLREVKNETYLSAKGPTAVIEYHRLVNDGIFFERSLQGRLRTLYTAYQSHPKLSLSCARELDGYPFDPEVAFGTSSPSLAAALREGDHLLLQASFYAEHRARLAILKAAIDLACQKPKTVNRIVGRTSSGFRKGLHTLPISFVDGLRWLTEQPTYRQYARLWQTFLWSWGGFILADRKDQEYAWLSEHSGVPVEEFPEALRAFDHFFPSGGWITRIGPYSDCRLVKMVPKVFQGLGAYHRMGVYGVEKYADLGYTDYTGNDLAKWHNIFVGFMSGEQPP